MTFPSGVIGRNVDNGSVVNVGSALGTKRVGRSAPLDTPRQGVERNTIADFRGLCVPECALKVHDDDNECGVHASYLGAHGPENLVNKKQGRRSSNSVDVPDDLAELEFGKY